MTGLGSLLHYIHRSRNKFHNVCVIVLLNIHKTQQGGFVQLVFSDFYYLAGIKTEAWLLFLCLLDTCVLG